MALLYITEYVGSGPLRPLNTGQAALPLAQEPGTDQTPLSFTTSAQSAAFAATTQYVRLLANSDCHVIFAVAPTATTSHQKLTAGVEYWRAVVPGQKVAAIVAV
ncbi:MAG: hypothetical protein AB7F22_07850 [Reyranella sp.]|uniref:hypothetical protein n=1 Tax=Reyranella sp. TaxID=1929291 RepID=UPI003D0CC643